MCWVWQKIMIVFVLTVGAAGGMVLIVMLAVTATGTLVIMMVVMNYDDRENTLRC